jgi:hypothetical protein
MAYYLVRCDGGELYNITLEVTGEEARRLSLPEDTLVRAVCVWSSAKALEDFKQRLSPIRPDETTPFGVLVRDVRAGLVESRESRAEDLIAQLYGNSRVGFVVVEPGPEQRIEWLDRFLLHLWGACKRVTVEAH